MQAVLLYTGAGVIFSWGAAHLIPTRGVVAGFGPISNDHKRIITMEWLSEGLTLCFIGVLAALMTSLVGPEQESTRLVVRACAGMLIVLAAVSALTGARTAVVPMRICPVIKSAVAVLFLAATLI